MMLNVFVTYRCNLSCPYCFARDLHKEYRRDMGQREFQQLLSWMRQAGVLSVAFLGGEPTLHPDLAEMVRTTAESGIAVTLFTNGLFSPEFVEQARPFVTNFVINYNEPGLYNSSTQRELLHSNLAALRDADCRITFSKNFAPNSTDYGYLLDGARKFGIKAIRYDLSRPGFSRENDHFTVDGTAGLMRHIVRFVRECENLNIRTGLDCCLKFCELSAADRAYLERVSMKFTGICHPSVDIHPDLSASYCLPLRHVCVDDITEFPSAERLIHHFAATVRPTRFENVSMQCHDCRDFKRKCQGGCMAVRRQSVAISPQEEAGSYSSMVEL